ncbi:MAG: hypothetical protein AMXMBFR34_06720 [Myxococcaceae bacterium]
MNTRLTRPDYYGLVVAFLSFAWAVLAVVKLQPAFRATLNDFGVAPSFFTALMLKPWLPLTLSGLPFIAVGSAIGFNASPAIRGVSYLVSGVLTVAQLVSFLVAMYLPVFAIADSIR